MIDERKATIATVTVTDHSGTKTVWLCDRCYHPIWNPDDARPLKGGRYHHRHWTDCIGYLRTDNAALKEQLSVLSGGGPTRHFTLNYRDPVTQEFIERHYLAWPIGGQDAGDIQFIADPAPLPELTP
jgi:hypothetical protein